jgi:hypothetical protein
MTFFAHNFFSHNNNIANVSIKPQLRNDGAIALRSRRRCDTAPNNNNNNNCLCRHFPTPTHTSRSTHANNKQVRQQFNPHTSLFFMIHGALDINLEASSEEKSVACPSLSTRDDCQSHTATSLPFRNLPAPLPRDIHDRQRTRCPLAQYKYDT